MEERPGEGYVAVDENGVEDEFRALFEDVPSGKSDSEPAAPDNMTDVEDKLTEKTEPTPDTSVTPATDRIVVSIPTELRSEFEDEVDYPANTEVVMLRDALRSVLSEAEECVRLCVPYLEIDGINLLQSEFDSLAESDVNLKILTRGVYDPMKYESGRARDLHALYQLTQRFAAKSKYGVVGIRDFQDVIRAESGSNKLEEKLEKSVHLKAVIADNRLAYIGSGEVRDSSMYTNFEGGTLIATDEVVSFWRDAFDFFYERGERVNIEYLKKD
ncbi:phospholipase D-like domain-containing protein [Haladaptatus sp. GCM10025893]|uniref:phospholipase D-like domain-containing protein n=1 Tax=Haladaptatus sp. GCM10025893 TaxID=3252659 RepID=UPI00360B0AB1